MSGLDPGKRRSIAELLAAWRAAERRWEHALGDEAVRVAALEVVAAWADYQNAALPAETREFMLVADDEQAYVGATRGVTAVLGYEPAELLAMRVPDLVVPDHSGETAQQWADFAAAGRLDGRIRLRTRTGGLTPLRFQARAHHPVPGFHVSRLWPDEGV